MLCTLSLLLILLLNIRDERSDKLQVGFQGVAAASQSDWLEMSLLHDGGFDWSAPSRPHGDVCCAA
jgi:hypothetical protein